MSSDLVMVSRQLDIDLPTGQSAFLWGARQVGKSTEPTERVVDGIRIVPWRSFLEQLWAGEVVN